MTSGRRNRCVMPSDDFYRGVAAALTVIAAADEQTLFDEIVRSCGRDELLRVAKKDGVLRFSGFTRYGYRTLPRDGGDPTGA